MREVELKSIVPDAEALRARLIAAGAREVFRGSLSDWRYDTSDGTLVQRDHVLRLRTYRDATGARAALDFKGPTGYDAGYKVREELSVACTDGDMLALMLDRLGYVVIREIDREIDQFELEGAVLRIEHYPRMDVLLEVEGSPESIEHAIAVAALPRDGFTSERLPDFVAKFEARTGQRAAICTRELSGDYRFSATNA